MAHLPAGTIIGGYRIEEVAGEGGMGVELEVGRDALWLNGSADRNTVLRIQP